MLLGKQDGEDNPKLKTQMFAFILFVRLKISYLPVKISGYIKI